MSQYIVYTTETFNRIYSDLDRSEQEWINKMKCNLEENITGKPLHFNWFLEKKYLNKRLYFLVDESSKRILFISFAPKKTSKK